MNDIIDSRKMKAMFLGGTRYLDNQKDMINALNVFPVPDGDTGTNMSLTLMSAARELKDLSDDASIDDVGRKIASGTLRGARGNSGVIMSQLLKDGFMEAVDIQQNESFKAGVLFARTEGIIPAPESCHAIAATVREALRCKETGEAKTILFNLSGHGFVDMSAYDQYLEGNLQDYTVSDEDIARFIKDADALN